MWSERVVDYTAVELQQKACSQATLFTRLVTHQGGEHSQRLSILSCGNEETRGVPTTAAVVVTVYHNKEKRSGVVCRGPFVGERVNPGS